MAVATSAVALIVGVVILMLVAIKLRGDVVETYFFQPIEQGRLLGATLLAGLLVATWVRSGTPWKVFTSLLIVAFAVAYVAFEQPHRDIK